MDENGACSLADGEAEARRDAWKHLLGHSPEAIRFTTSGVQVTLRATADTEHELRSLAAQEAECCGFASWVVRCDEDDLTLDVTAAEKAVRAVHRMFRGDARMSEPRHEREQRRQAG